MVAPARRIVIAFLVALLLASACPGVVAAAPPTQEQTVHVVQAGETLFRIAQTYGVTVDDIVAANDLADRNLIHVGQRLIIPASAVSPPPTLSTDYIVQPGDTLWLIAQRFNTTVEAIAQASGIVNPNLIFVGQSLAVPTPQGAPPPPSQTVIHVVQPGETLARIALRYNTTVWAIAQVNDLSNPNIIHLGQRLVIPGPGDDVEEQALIPPFTALLFRPTPAMQGQTVAVHVSTDREVTLSGTFDGRLVRFVGGEATYWALIGIHVIAQPGPYPLELTAVDVVGNTTRITTRITHIVQVAAGEFQTDYITLPPGKGSLLDPELLRQERERLAVVFGGYRPEKLWSGLFQVPVEKPRITSPFGSRRSYNGGPATSYHAGTDFGGAEGTPVYAPASGVVVLAEALAVRGSAVIVDHGLGVFTGYWHLSGIAVEVGQPVVSGSLLGYVGTTGLSTGPHLHWELRVGGIPVDAIQWTERMFP